ncbi:hypothetical protein ACULNC_27070 [Shigella flexneri]
MKLAHNALTKGLIDKDEAAILVKAKNRMRSINVDDLIREELATKPVKFAGESAES